MNPTQSVILVRFFGASQEDARAIQDVIQARGMRAVWTGFDADTSEADGAYLQNCSLEGSDHYGRTWRRCESGRQSQVYRTEFGDELVLNAYMPPTINGHELHCQPSPTSDLESFFKMLQGSVIGPEQVGHEFVRHLIPKPMS
ncbi:MAG: hypothetical protein HY986_07570 [Candidatus Melainabacteria bacterium]|nr:hypothetical protein [Candidatus Melainabacteria bacterium]